MSTQDGQPSSFSRFLAEMKRRHVVRFALGYAAAAFVVLQLAEIVFPAFDIGGTGLRILVVAVALLFPPAVVLAWVFDITAEGIKKTSDAEPEGRPLPSNSLMPRVSLLVLTVGMVGAVGVWMAREGVLDEPGRDGRASRGTPTLVAYDPSVPIRSLAVLPLDNFSGDGGPDYFTAGLQEELIAQLAQIAGLRVVSRTSVQRYHDAETPIPQIGRDLQVDAVIEGSVRRDANQVRITLQLIHAASDTHVWAHQYDRPLTDVLALQSEVALDIANQIQAEVGPDEATALQRVASRDVAPAAQDAYLRGKFELSRGTQEGNQAALRYFEEAVDVDSTFAPALANLAGTRFLVGMSDSSRTPSSMAQAQQEAARALAMDSTSAEAREVMTLITRSLPGPVPAGTPKVATDPVQLTPWIDVVVALPDIPGMDTAWVTSLTQLGQRIADQMRARGATTEEAANVQRLMGARQLMATGMFSEASSLLSDLVDDAPDFAPAWELLARTEISSGDPEAAAGAIEGWSARGGDGAPTTAEARALREAVEREGGTGYWRWTLGRLDAREAAGRHVSATERAAALAATGDKEGAFEALENALEGRDRGLATLERDPIWDALRADARFADVVRRSRSLRRGPDVPGAPRDGSRR
jgi:TolB-like protein